MNTPLIALVIGVGLNLLITGFSAGKLYQKLADLCRHVNSLEKKVNNTDEHLDKVRERLANIEGQLKKPT